ncbi:double zinc ribbon and ankyrin repeat-containing protein 1-like [Anneissia japonica]|uniref:double zinc ribbon and ankyrin repeat-containing protein 1-like n=1 Tax=Anneissia japonica TaxID=1529436 RepID=UPI001425621F|nr:double zinc ribbon and ankyrin repeat-containing protein 1-like [Anneissia japonica]XP_033110854.1 double zinc ribbon and ankyrin repeat-containing protein 1-like [Anneissia japonica]
MAAGAVCVPSIIPLRAPIPGKSKLSIDTNTLIEMGTDTKDSVIYYTLDGTKPNPFQQLGEKTTMKYKEPFMLPEGRIMVKSMAVTRDKTRESSIVCKVFDVEWVPGTSTDSDGDTARSTSRGVSPGLKSTATSKSNGTKGSNYRKPTKGTRFMEDRLGSKTPSMTGRSPMPGSRTPTATQPMTSPSLNANQPINPPQNITQTNRLQRKTDFMKCVFCNADRPADPYARFCIACGSPVPPLPNTRLPPPEPGDTGICVYCNAMVPLNTNQCLVCEMPITPQLIPQASVKLKDKLLCTGCGTANPANLQYCVTCELTLQGNSKPVYSGLSAPPKPSKGGRLLCCNKCGRVNNSDARYCDWCGAKPSPSLTYLRCSKCSASNQPYATFCHSCGCFTSPPVRHDIRNNGITVGGRSTSQVLDAKGSSAWVPMSMPKDPTPTDSVGTQTVGLFYPSNKHLKNTNQNESMAVTEKKPPLTAVSPGKGYWRQQIDHICGHLKTHAQNNTEFRGMISEPKIGKLISATVHEDGYELSVNVCYALRGNRDALTGKPLDVSKGGFLSQLTEGRRHSFSGSTGSFEEEKKTAKSTTKKKVKKNDKLTAQDKELLKEVGPKGEGRDDEVQRILDEGADSNCENSDGIPVLSVATINNRVECLPILLSAGADINKKAGPRGNAALHDAVLLGPEGEEVVKTLLSAGASTKVKNNKDETAYELASRQGYENIITCFASTAGQDMLTKLMKQNTKKPAPEVF